MTDENGGDDEVRAAFDDLKSATQSLDAGAARREIEGQPEGHRWMRLVPLGVLAFFVGVLGLTYAVTTNDDPDQLTTDAADGGAVDGDDAGAGSNELAGTTWVLTEGAPIVNGWPATLTFEADTFGGTAACNGYGGSYTIDGSVLELGEIAQDSAGCEERVLESEEVFLTGLRAVDSFLLDGDRLVLSGTEPDLVLIPDGATSVGALIGETWLLVEYSDGEESVGADGTGGHLLLNADGTLEGGTGCRSLNGTWVENGAEILFPSFAAEGECSEQLARQDSQVTTVLGDGFRAELTGDKLFLTSAGNESLFYVRSFGDDEPVVEDEVGFPFHENLAWSVILVEVDDVLNVRSGPGIDKEIVGELEPYETGITAGTEVVDVKGDLWRQVHTPSIPGGWVNEQYLTAQPMVGADDEGLWEIADFMARESPRLPQRYVGESVWIGGIGVYADYPFPAKRVSWDDWTTPVDFTPDEMIELDVECPECSVTPLAFVRFPGSDGEFDILVDHDLLADEGLAGPTFLYGPVADLANMYHVTIDVPATEVGLADWQRIHLFFDWRTGEPLLHAIYTWGWTP